MSETALYATYRAIRSRLITPGEPWAQRAYPGQAPAGSARPYVVYRLAAGGELNDVVQEDASLLIDVICVAEEMGQSMQGAARIAELLNDQGRQDYGVSVALNGGSEWTISTVTQEITISMIVNVEGAQQIYQDGGRYRFRVERIS